MGRQLTSAPRHGGYYYCALLRPSTVRMVLVVHADVVEVVHELKGVRRRVAPGGRCAETTHEPPPGAALRPPRGPGGGVFTSWGGWGGGGAWVGLGGGGGPLGGVLGGGGTRVSGVSERCHACYGSSGGIFGSCCRVGVCEMPRLSRHAPQYPETPSVVLPALTYGECGGPRVVCEQ